MFFRPPPSVSASQLLIRVWVSLILSLPYTHFSELPPRPLETPGPRAPARTVTKEQGEHLCLNPGVHCDI